MANEIYQLEKYLETAAVTILENNGLNAYLGYETGSIEVPAVEVFAYSDGPKMDAPLATSPTEDYGFIYDMKLQCRILTDRNESTHRETQALIRRLFRDNTQFYLSSSLFPYHNIDDVYEGASTVVGSHEEYKRVDVSEVEFKVIMSIKPEQLT